VENFKILFEERAFRHLCLSALFSIFYDFLAVYYLGNNDIIMKKYTLIYENFNKFLKEG